VSGGTCAIHGPQESWTGVCLAIGDALKEGKAVGFVWGIGDQDFRWAMCTHCDGVVRRGLAVPHKMITLCPSCFEEAWELNGKPERDQ
jgi:hypothetical protein